MSSAFAKNSYTTYLQPSWVVSYRGGSIFFRQVQPLWVEQTNEMRAIPLLTSLIVRHQTSGGLTVLTLFTTSASCNDWHDNSVIVRLRDQLTPKKAYSNGWACFTVSRAGLSESPNDAPAPQTFVLLRTGLFHVMSFHRSSTLQAQSCSILAVTRAIHERGSSPEAHLARMVFRVMVWVRPFSRSREVRFWTRPHERLRAVFTTRRYTNSRLPLGYLYLPPKITLRLKKVCCKVSFCENCQRKVVRHSLKNYLELEMRSVERGICPIATSIGPMNELFQ